MSEFNNCLDGSYDILSGVSLSFMGDGDFGGLLTSSCFPTAVAEEEVEVQSSQVVQGSQAVEGSQVLSSTRPRVSEATIVQSSFPLKCQLKTGEKSYC